MRPIPACITNHSKADDSGIDTMIITMILGI